MRGFFILGFLVLLGTTTGSPKSYDHDVVIRLTPTTEKQLQILQLLMAKETGTMDFWAEPSKIGRSVEIHLQAEHQERQIDGFEKLGFKVEKTIEDVGALIQSQKRSSGTSRWSNWLDYEEYEDIVLFLSEITEEHSDIVTLSSIGQSYEGEEIWMMNINKPNAAGNPKTTIVFEFNIHAREWISSAVGTFFINDLLTNPDKDALLQQWDIHIVPVLNVDGFKYTKTDSRLWRKTRSVNPDSVFDCRGADPNRNWDSSFAGPGTSDNPCSEVYHGSSAFSEPETKALADYISAMEQKPLLYIAYHSYSQMILLPFGDSFTEPEDYDDLMAIGLPGEAALEAVYGTEYETDTIPNLLGLASGGSIDWIKAEAGIKYSFAFELRDKGQFGFLLPAEQIIPCAEETIVGTLAMMEAVLQV